MQAIFFQKENVSVDAKFGQVRITGKSVGLGPYALFLFSASIISFTICSSSSVSQSSFSTTVSTKDWVLLPYKTKSALNPSALQTLARFSGLIAFLPNSRLEIIGVDTPMISAKSSCVRFRDFLRAKIRRPICFKKFSSLMARTLLWFRYCNYINHGQCNECSKGKNT